MSGLLAAADTEGFWFKAGIAAIGPLFGAIVGSLIIGLFIQGVTRRAQERREKLDLRHELVQRMNEAANGLYMQTQMYWRATTGRDTGLDTAELREDLDTQYVKSRVDGFVLESRLDNYFSSDDPRQKWHRAMDFLTVRYFQVLEPDKGLTRAKRLERLYRANVGPECTGSSIDQLNRATVVMTGYRRALREATIGVLTEGFRDERSFKTAYRESGRVAVERAAQDNDETDSET
jgi:hypothetical protein